MASKKKIPTFNSEDEEREFWDTHDFNDYIDWSQAKRLDLSHLRPARLDENPFMDVVLILTESRPGWALLDLIPVPMPNTAWRLLSTLAERPGESYSHDELAAKLHDSGTVGDIDVGALASLIKTAFEEAAEGRGRLIRERENGRVFLDLLDRNIIFAISRVGVGSAPARP